MGRKYRQSNQAGSIGRAVRTGEFWEEERGSLWSTKRKPDIEQAR